MAQHGGEAGHEEVDGMDMSEMIKPTWATSPTPQGKIYVAGNGAGKILEIDLEDW